MYYRLTFSSFLMILVLGAQQVGHLNPHSIPCPEQMLSALCPASVSNYPTQKHSEGSPLPYPMYLLPVPEVSWDTSPFCSLGLQIRQGRVKY